jgi:hypothetical protein
MTPTITEPSADTLEGESGSLAREAAWAGATANKDKAEKLVKVKI